MTGPGIRELYALFEQCLEYPPHEREAVARARCGDDSELLRTLLRLLRKDRHLDAAPAQADPGLSILGHLALPEFMLRGRRIGPFLVEDCIGSGGMGSVYRVRRVDGQVQQYAALKILKPFSLNDALLSRFSNERRVLATLIHPGICRFLDAGTLAEGQPYVLMELIDGTPLYGYCDRNGLHLKQRLVLFLKVLQAVAYAHRKLVVHRDIKSGNVLVTEDGEPKLLDFGIAKSLQAENAALTQTVDRFLTPRSAAPEQYLGEPVGVGCDIYALGQLLYELLCGVPPFDFTDASAAQLERMLLEHPPPPLSQRCLAATADAVKARGFSSAYALAQSLRGDLETIVLKCLRKRPDERYASVEQLDAEIRRVLSNRPIRARQGERWYRLRKFVLRNRLAVGLGSALAMTLVVSLGIMLVQAIGMANERSRALLERDRARYAVSLLQEAFVAADPIRAMGGEVTAKQILQSARGPMAEIMESTPALFASLAAVLAQVELDLMLDDAAAEILEQGLQAAQWAGMSESSQRQLLLLKARALTDSNDRESAARVLDRVHALDGYDAGDWLLAKGRWLLLDSRPREAVPYLERAVQAWPDVPGGRRMLFDARADLAHAMSMLGAHERSLEIFAESLALLEADQLHDHPLMILTRYRQVDALRQAGQLDRAWSEALEIKSLMARMYGADSAVVGRMHAMLGRLEMARGNRMEAAGHYADARQIWMRALGPEHPNQLRVTINLAHALAVFDDRVDEAEALFHEALAMADRRLGGHSATALTVRAYLAWLIGRRGDAVDAMRILLADGQLTWDEVASNKLWLDAFRESQTAVGCDYPGLAAPLARSCRELLAQLREAPELD